MLVGDLVNTAMNLVAFAFIGAMIWLFVRPLAPPDEQSGEPEDDAL